MIISKVSNEFKDKRRANAIIVEAINHTGIPLIHQNKGKMNFPFCDSIVSQSSKAIKTLLHPKKEKKRNQTLPGLSTELKLNYATQMDELQIVLGRGKAKNEKI